MTKKITPPKGGRSVRKSTDVTPRVAEMLAYLWKEHKISLGDLVSMAARAIYEEKHSQEAKKEQIMSYSTGPAPAALKLEIVDNQLVLSFTCPCCNKRVERVIDPTDLLYDVSVPCNHPQCTEPGERVGYTLTMIPLWEGRELDLSDRPLYEP